MLNSTIFRRRKNTMKFTERYARIFQLLLPSPFTIAIMLSLLSFAIAFIWGNDLPANSFERLINITSSWERGLWNGPLLIFAIQMMLMLVLGHVLALSKPMEKLINQLVKLAKNSASSALLVSLSTMLVAYFNWGLALIFGAILARKVAEQAVREGRKINYPLIGAAGYLGLLVWHGGISGSSLAKVAENGHLKGLMSGYIPEAQITLLPDQISFAETVFSPLNIFCSILCLALIPGLFYWMGKKSSGESVPRLKIHQERVELEQKIVGADRLDHSKILSRLFGLFILSFSGYLVFQDDNPLNFGFINPNYINFTLLGLALLFHRNFYSFLKAIDEAIGGASGILIQFPLYFGIMGIMKDSGLVNELSAFFVEHSSGDSFPLFTLFSAGLVNIFVPSGGGQWAIQGPILVQASLDLGISIPKSIMAMAYGDQLTNMLQPFWALPLLGITGLKAKEILPYTLIAMILALLIFLSALLIF